MRKAFLVWVLGMSVASSAYAQWTNLSRGLDDADIQFVTADSRHPERLFAAAGGRVYKSADGGEHWKRVLSIRGEGHEVRFLLVDPLNSEEVYAATDKGVRLSRDGGEKWKAFYEGIGERGEESLCVAVIPQTPEEIYVGTAEGLFSVNKKTLEARRLEGLPKAAVYSLCVGQGEELEVFAATAKGIYRGKGDLGFWERVLAGPGEKETIEETSLEQFEIEEILAEPFFSNLAFLGAANRFYAGTREGVWEAARDGGTWFPKDHQNLPDKKVNAVACSASSLYVATDQGLFRAGPKTEAFTSFDAGLDSKEVRYIFYNPGGDYLVAATERGVFKYVYPELGTEPQVLIDRPRTPEIREVMELFQHEPAIEEVQAAAIRYAEVHPGKIEGWRRAATLKAWLPSVSVDTGVSTDENIDIDRGGTNDPDRFILGPKEKSYDWSVGFNWDLGDLVWNNDQTSIDTRSRLMVELRDDILNEVTHLYYERRRLQVEMMLSSSKELPVQIEKELRLQELTANIDALTGGYFSKRLGNVGKGKEVKSPNVGI